MDDRAHPSPSGASLSGVSCTSESACTAVGDYYNGPAGVSAYTEAHIHGTLVETWNGRRWATVPTPNPSGADNFFSGVSCTSATTCTAVGSGHGGTLVEAWNGARWAIEHTPNPTGAQKIISALSGVSYTSATVCTAVGSGPSGTLAEAWSGATFAIEHTPNPSGSGNDSLLGVSCTSAAACTAVGSEGTAFGADVTLVEAWNGTTWTIEPSLNPTASRGSSLSEVSCTLATSCSAVASYTTRGGEEVTLAEAWNGTTWGIEPTANPSGVRDSHLSAVSCTSATACAAVGYLNGGGNDQTLAEAWNGTAWAIEPTPNPNGNGDLHGVSCTSASACVAVGMSGLLNYGDTNLTLAEAWNGTT